MEAMDRRRVQELCDELRTRPVEELETQLNGKAIRLMDRLRTKKADDSTPPAPAQSSSSSSQ